MIEIIKYYSRSDIKKAILAVCKNREVAFKLGDKGFGRRPDVLQFENDIVELAQQGATSFHISEELWSNPLHLKTGMSKKELDSLRIGWDLVLDLDGVDFELAKIAAEIIIEALDYYEIYNPSIKFSGNKGLHIALPYNSFPKKVNDVEIRLMFPELSRYIANFIKNMIKDHLSQRILDKYSLNEIESTFNIKKDEYYKSNVFNPFSLIDIDSVLISSRHMFRAPYSVNEKSGLASIPLSKNELKTFNKKQAILDDIEVKNQFLNPEEFKENEAKHLFIQALDWQAKLKTQETERPLYIKSQQDTIKISDKFFPECIKKILAGIKTDGRKRALFVLITFLRKSNYLFEDIEPLLLDWNKRNYQPLPEPYIKTQLSWHKRQKQDIMPPNCDNEAYYLNLGVKCTYCDKFKNPLNYASRMSKLSSYNKTKHKKT